MIIFVKSAPVEQRFQLDKVRKITPYRKTDGFRLHSHVPLMVGINRHEGSFLLSKIYSSFLLAKNRHKDSHYLKNHFVRDLLTSSHFGLFKIFMPKSFLRLWRDDLIN